MHRDSLKIKGRVTLKHYNKNGDLLHCLENQNLIVDTGLDFFIKKILDIPIDSELGDAVGYIGIGNGEAQTSSNQTGLTPSLAQDGNSEFVHETEYKEIRYKNSTSNTLVVEATFVDGDYPNGDVVEVGLFTNVIDAYGPATMIARTVVESENRFTKADADYLSVSWNIQFGD